MRRTDFFIERDHGLGSTDVFNEELVRALRIGPIEGHSDVEAASALARLVHDELEAYGTGGGEVLDDDEMRTALRALEAAAHRVGLDEFEVPFSDFTRFKSWWVRNDARGSWQARRDLLEGIFEPLHDQLARLEASELTSTLADPITARPTTGWGRVDEEIAELRRHFRTARTPQDYRAVGLDCVAVTEALSRHCYDPERHLRDGESEPPVANTKQRLERFVEDAAPGRANAEIRKMARAAIELAQAIKHQGTPSRRDAGIAADSVIQLANILRRLDEPE
jgi:hypothetical protein